MRSLHDRAGIRDIALDTAVHGHSDSKCCKTSGRKAHGGETKEEEPLFGLLRRTQMLANGHVGKPLLMWVAVLIYGVCTTLWWLGGSFRGDNCETLEGSSPQAAVDPRTLDSSLIDPQSIHVPKLTCLGWRETSTCAGIQNVLPVETNRSCDAPIIGGMASGYCMMLDEATGEEVQAFSVNCSSVMLGQRFRCRQAADIAKTSAELERAIAQAKWNNAIETQNQATLRRMDELQTPTSGIVMVVYPKLLVSVHATIRLLRTVHKCALPIEVWYLKSEMMRGSTVPVETQPVLQSLVNDYGPTTLRQIRDSRARGFYAKIYALLNSKFDQVLFLDADNMPVRDPAFLFTESKAFQATGAVFWPDFWLPPHTIFNIHEQSVLWEVIGMPFVDMFEQESGQVLIDKRRAKASGALAALEYLAFYRPNYIAGMQMAYGDKDLFRLAWMKAGAQFHMVPHPPATAGSTFEGVEGTVFCGMTMVQFDPDASANAGPEAILFMHRNSKKLTGEEEEDKDVVWTHVQVFKYPEEAMATPAMQYEHAREFYRIEYGGMSDVAKIVRCNQCYGDRNLKSPYFQLTPVDEVGASWHIRDLETSLLRFGREAMELHTQLQTL